MNPPPRLFDAHNHLHDARLQPHREAVDHALASIGCTGAMVNGTREEDWSEVASFAASRPWVRVSFGLHPWHAPERTPRWLDSLREALQAAGPAAGVGEIGLDAWIAGHDLDDQRRVLLAQLQLAADDNRAATIHCIQAWGPLLDTLRAAPLPERGFLLHAYAGAAEMVVPFAKLGAYFSFNPAHLAARKHARREVFRQIPAERLLVETDAPDLSPPPEYTRFPLPPDASGRSPNHPAHLAVTYEELARIRGCPLEVLARTVEENFHRLFG